MRWGVLAAWWVPAFLACLVSLQAHAATPCAASPEAAVLQGLGIAQSSTGDRGYRVRDVVVDPLLQRTFVRVERCDSAQTVAVLLPFAHVQAMHGGQRAASPGASLSPRRQTDVKAGTDVEVAMRSDRVNFLLHGKTVSAAEVGGLVDVEAASLQVDGPVRHLRGLLVSAERVEVQP